MLELDDIQHILLARALALEPRVLLCDEPVTLDELLVIADNYATADSSMKTELRVDASGKVLAPAPKTPAGDSN